MDHRLIADKPRRASVKSPAEAPALVMGLFAPRRAFRGPGRIGGDVEIVSLRIAACRASIRWRLALRPYSRRIWCSLLRSACPQEAIEEE